MIKIIKVQQSPAIDCVDQNHQSSMPPANLGQDKLIISQCCPPQCPASVNIHRAHLYNSEPLFFRLLPPLPHPLPQVDILCPNSPIRHRLFLPLHVSPHQALEVSWCSAFSSPFSIAHIHFLGLMFYLALTAQFGIGCFVDLAVSALVKPLRHSWCSSCWVRHLLSSQVWSSLAFPLLASGYQYF
jgi:hypothetical protein